MKHFHLLMLCVLAVAAPSRADEIPLESKIDSVGLFKNGLAVVHRSVQVSGSGIYRVEDVPVPVHGTYWIDGDVPVETQVTMREVDAPVRMKPGIDFQQDLVGRAVNIRFHDGTLPGIKGTVVALDRSHGGEAWSRRYLQPQYGSVYGDNNVPTPGQYLVLETMLAVSMPTQA